MESALQKNQLTKWFAGKLAKAHKVISIQVSMKHMLSRLPLGPGNSFVKYTITPLPLLQQLFRHIQINKPLLHNHSPDNVKEISAKRQVIPSNAQPGDLQGSDDKSSACFRHFITVL